VSSRILGLDERELPDRGFVRRALLAIGIFSLMVAGIHAGADRFDDLAFSALNLVDRAADSLFAGIIEAVGGLFGAERSWIDANSYRAAELVDLDLKLAAARYAALGLELVVDAILAVPILDPTLPRAGGFELRRSFAAVTGDPTVLRFAAPLAAAAACLAGALVISRELGVVGHEVATQLSLSPVASVWLSRGIGLAVLSLAIGVLSVRAFARAMVRADRLAFDDASGGTTARRRRLRGWPTALIALPLAAIALHASGDELAKLGALFG
jgi:hypothetical protein